MKVKICGFKSKEDALFATNIGVDAIGLLVGQTHTSNDFITKEVAKEIVQALPPFVSTVLVTHLTNPNEIIELTNSIGNSTIQLHGDITPGDVKIIRNTLSHIKLIKTIHISDENSISNGLPYVELVNALLLDTVNVDTNQIGGTGLTHDWGISKKAVETYAIPVILAGGLNSDNVTDAINAVSPFGVDANSGTKGTDGMKDFSKVKKFIENAKA